MGVTCPACGTENRSVAKFCIECIESLPTVFAPTEILPHMPHAAHRATFLREPDIRADAALPRASGFVAATGATSAAPATSANGPASQTPPLSSGPRRTVEGRKGLWVSVAAFAIALVIGAAGWLVAGAGGLYIYAFGHSGVGGEPEVAVVTAPVERSATVMPTIAPAASIAPLASSTPLNPLAPLPPFNPLTQTEPSIATPSAQVVPPTSAVGAASVNRATSRSAVTTTPPAIAVAPAATRTPAKASVSLTAPGSRASTATVATDPKAQCTGLGFFAASRCMAAQCAKAEHSAHPSCVAVLQQQRLMEEKRNPTMAN